MNTLGAVHFPNPLCSPGWCPDVAFRLGELISSRELQGGVAVFDLDNTCLAYDIGEATFESLVRQGRLGREKLSPECRSVFGVEIPGFADIVQFYREFLSLAEDSADPAAATKAIYIWLGKIMAGLTIRDVVEATVESFRGSSNPRLFKTPYPYLEMLELIRALKEAQLDIWFISATNPWSVRVALSLFFNEYLERAGIDPISPCNVVGLSTAVMDKQGQLFTDRELVSRDEEYAALSPFRLNELTITDQIIGPVSAFEGKAIICKELLPSPPVFGAGDSENDFPMLEEAKWKLWIARPSKKKALAEIREKAGSDGSWLVQRVAERTKPSDRLIFDPTPF